MKGIIAAGGLGTRLAPGTQVLNKHLLLVYDKPMIYYPLATLIEAGIREVLIVASKRDVNVFKELVGDGSWMGMKISYIAQPYPRGVADTFVLGESFIGKDSVTLALGDNIFIGDETAPMLINAANTIKGSGGGVIFTQEMANPSSFGVVELDGNGKPISIEEKPAQPKSRNAIVGLYVYDNSVVKIAKGLKPSARGEIEMRDINRDYMKRGKLHAVQLDSGIIWRDAGTPDSLLSISNIVSEHQRKTGQLVGAIEEAAYKNGWIAKDDLERLAAIINSDYGRKLEMSVAAN